MAVTAKELAKRRVISQTAVALAIKKNAGDTTHPRPINKPPA